ncbi:15448_t:CDS:2 [Entrophospora sp. SA101]|nr:15448_t:CDS:2 [Entrophospora sp. SA101]
MERAEIILNRLHNSVPKDIKHYSDINAKLYTLLCVKLAPVAPVAPIAPKGPNDPGVPGKPGIPGKPGKTGDNTTLKQQQSSSSLPILTSILSQTNSIANNIRNGNNRDTSNSNTLYKFLNRQQQQKQQLEDEEVSNGIMVTKIHSVSIHHEDFTLDEFDDNGIAASFKSAGTGTNESDDTNNENGGYLDGEAKSRIMRERLTTSITSSVSTLSNNNDKTNRNSFNSTISNLTIKEELRKANVKFYI